MRRALALFLAAVICVAAAWWVSLLPGTFTATIAGTTLETSTPVALTLLVALFLLLYFLIRMVALLLSLPRRGRNWRSHRNRVRGDAAVTQALVALAANDAGAARREAERSRRLLGDTPLTLLLAVQAGRQAGREEESVAALRQLAASRDGKLLGLRGLLRLAMERQDWEEAAKLAAQAEAAHPGAAWLRDERRSLALQTGQWREALLLAGPDQRATLALAAAEQEESKPAALKYAKQAFEADPALPAAALAYARRLRDAGRDRAAQDVLRRAWAARPHPEIAEEYVAGISDKLARAREVAALARTNPDNPESCIAVARTALEAGLTSEARRQLERARAAGLNERRVWQLLADVATMEGDATAAQDALQHVRDADPDPAWRCTSCGTQHGRWHPVCDVCHSTGAITWGTPGAGSVRPHAGTPPAAIEGLTA